MSQFAGIVGTCLAPTCGEPLELGDQTQHTSAVLRYTASCTGCGRLYALTVTLRSAPHGVDPWVERGEPVSLLDG